MYTISISSEDCEIKKNVKDESWHAILEEFFFALQGAGFCFKFSPEEMVNLLHDAIDEASEKVE